MCAHFNQTSQCKMQQNAYLMWFDSFHILNLTTKQTKDNLLMQWKKKRRVNNVLSIGKWSKAKHRHLVDWIKHTITILLCGRCSAYQLNFFLYEEKGKRKKTNQIPTIITNKQIFLLLAYAIIIVPQSAIR